MRGYLPGMQAREVGARGARRYDPLYCDMVFPLGACAAASRPRGLAEVSLTERPCNGRTTL